MGRSRIEAFSDGVIAIIITIMVLEISAPVTADFSALKTMLPSLFSYLISFGLVGTYWNNHHHLFHLIKQVNGKILWTNLLFLLTLSLFPVCTDWVAKTKFAQFPVSVYLVVMIITTLAYILLRHFVLTANTCGKTTTLKRDNKKEIASVILEAIGLVISFITPIRWLSAAFIVALIPIWIIPDLRISKLFDGSNHDGEN